MGATCGARIIWGWKRAAATSTLLREGGRRKRQECEARVERRRARFGGKADKASGVAIVGVCWVVFGTVIPLSAR